MAASREVLSWAILATGAVGHSRLFTIEPAILKRVMPLLQLGSAQLDGFDTKFRIRRLDTKAAVFQTAHIESDYWTSCIICWSDVKALVSWRMAVRLQQFLSPMEPAVLCQWRENPPGLPWMAVAEKPPKSHVVTLAGNQPELELAVAWGLVAKYGAQDHPTRSAILRHASG